MSYNNQCSHGHLAQLVEHLLDVQGVSGSIPLVSTIKKSSQRLLFLMGFGGRAAKPL